MGIIHRHVITGQWQLTEFDAYPWSKNIRAFPITKENEKNALQKNRSSHREKDMSNKILELEEKIISQNETIESLQNQNNFLNSIFTQALEDKNQIEKELKLIIHEKQNKIEVLNENFKSLIMEKENEIDILEHSENTMEIEIHDLKKKNLEFEKE